MPNHSEISRLRPGLRSLTVIAALCALLLAACGGGADEPVTGVATLADQTDVGLGESAVETDATGGEETAPAEPIDPETAALDFTQCLRDEGLDVADVGVDADGRIQMRDAFENVDRQDEGFREAMETCRPLIQNAGFGQGQRAAIGENIEVQDALVAFSQCVREAGYDVGDITLGGQGQGAGQGAGADGEAGQGQRGQGQRQQGFGNRSDRFATQMGLDPEDPEVVATIEACSPALDAAFAVAGFGQGQGQRGG